MNKVRKNALVFAILLLMSSTARPNSIEISKKESNSKEWKKNFPTLRVPVTELPSPDKTYIFFLAGQSNMAGRGFVEPQDTISNKRIIALDENNKWIYAKEPLHYYEPKFTGLDCGMSFAKQMLSKVPDDVTIALVPCAVGGSSIERWLNDEEFRGVKLLSNFKNKVAEAQKLGAIKGILWHQGESNAKETLIPSYHKKQLQLFDIFRTTTGKPNLPIVLGQLGTYAEPVEKQKRWNEINNIVSSYKTQENYGVVKTKNLVHKGDKVHFDSNSQRTMGKRFAKEMTKLLDNKTCDSEPIVTLRYEQDETLTYDEIISAYKKLDRYSPISKLMEVGTTDSGEPLHLFVISKSKTFTPEECKKENKTIVFINNGIHPGEPCGIDASLKFIDELLRNENNQQEILDSVTLCIVPVYSVGGCKNRSAYFRANQVGPIESGFRGNARNLDLNRDFMKCDSKNAMSFNQTINKWDPDLFLDTHTTNGSDHQYSITLIPTCTSSLPTPMEKFQRSTLLPQLYTKMKASPYELIPYVTWSNNDPDKGIQMTFESPRYSTGYTRLLNTYGFMTENHVYKSYTKRVESVYHFIKTLATTGATYRSEILNSRQKAKQELMAETEYALGYKTDTTQFETIKFKGYETELSISSLTGKQRFTYNRNKPYTKQIKYFSTHTPVHPITKPKAYLLPQAWHEAIDRLKWNGVELKQLTKDTLLTAECYYFHDLKYAQRPYNGHFYHSEFETKVETIEIRAQKGDYWITTDQDRIAYIMEAIEPKALDSFFRWNFFDSVLDQREYFSPWGFEENAQRYLEEHPEFAKQWRTEKEQFSTHREQMNLLYETSEWKEKTHLRYPVFRIME